jgi:hypothetical protein
MMAHQGRFRLAGHTVWSVRADTKPVSKLPACVWAATARGSSVADDTTGPRGSDSRKHHNNKLQEAPFAGVHVACVNKIGRQCIVSIDSAAISRSNVIFLSRSAQNSTTKCSPPRRPSSAFTASSSLALLFEPLTLRFPLPRSNTVLPFARYLELCVIGRSSTSCRCIRGVGG